jgi:hypothetical protein
MKRLGLRRFNTRNRNAEWMGGRKRWTRTPTPWADSHPDPRTLDQLAGGDQYICKSSTYQKNYRSGLSAQTVIECSLANIKLKYCNNDSGRPLRNGVNVASTTTWLLTNSCKCRRWEIEPGQNRFNKNHFNMRMLTATFLYSECEYAKPKAR